MHVLPALRVTAVGAALFALANFATGCARSTLREAERPTAREVIGLGTGYFDERVEAFVVPPDGWQPDPPKIDGERTHLAWLSPTGDTAYGVVYFNVPGIVALVPKGEFLHGRVTDEYVRAFERDTGDATERLRWWDADRNGMRTEVEGGPYYVRSLLRIRGTRGWSVYAGTLRGRPVDPVELALSERAREATQIGTDARGGADAAQDVALTSDR